MNPVATTLIALLLVVWIGAVGLWSLEAWPQLPLDVPSRDPAIAALYQRAVTAHIARSVGIAALPFVVLGAALLVARRRRAGGR